MDTKGSLQQAPTAHSVHEDEKVVEISDAERVSTNYDDNYHGLTLQAVLVFTGCTLINIAQLMNLVAAGAFGRDIAATIGGSGKVVWLPQSMTILCVCLGPIVCQASDFWGRKWFVVITGAFGVAGSIIMSRATSMNMAIASQCLTGLCYGAQPLLHAVPSEILPRRVRTVAQGTITAAISLAALAGLTGGAAMLQRYNEGFRNYWYMMTALFAISVILVLVFYNPPPRPLQRTLTQREKLRRLDWVAYALLIVGVVCISLGLVWAQNPYPWSSPHVLAPLIIGIVTLIGLVVHQLFFKKDGLIHHDLFKKDRNFAISLVCIAVDGMAFFGVNSYFTFQVQFLYQPDFLLANLCFGLLFIGAIVGSMLVGVYVQWSRRLREPLVLSNVFYVVFYALMATLKLGDSKAVWGYAVLVGLGSGISLTVLVSAAQFSAPAHLIATGSGLTLAARSGGATVGLAIFTSVFYTSLNDKLPKEIANAVLPMGFSPEHLGDLIQGLASHDDELLASLPGSTPAILGTAFGGMQKAYLASFRNIWLGGAVISGVALIVSCFVINPSKDFNMHVDAPLDKDE